MESKEKRMVPLEKQLKVLVCTNNASAGEQCFPHHDSDLFYTKLTELLESSGLSLIFNVRETSLDLYLFYLEVTRRGGYRQVGREKKWGEVVLALKLEGNSVKLSAQVEKLYAHLLYQFEQLYFYRLPSKQVGPSSSKDPLKKKQNSTASLPQIVEIKATEMAKDFSCHMTGAGYVEQPVLLPPSSNGKEKKKRRRGAPVGRKNAYQIFLKHECARLKTCSRDLERNNILRIAIEAWRNMSEIEKQPYVEQSKKMNNEEIKEAMNSNNKQQSTEDTSLCGDYLVTSQPEADDSLVNNANVGLALKMAEKATKDPSFLMDWYS